MEKLIAYCGLNCAECGACKEFTTCKTINDFMAIVPGVRANLV